MCGIIGYSGPRNGTKEVLRGLKQLEYRGYDSAGIAAVDEHGGLSVVRSVGRVESLRQKLGATDMVVRAAIGHTRWATHGTTKERNAHPHVDCHGRLAVVHNGIVENAGVLRLRLANAGHTLHSDTDSECIAHLIEEVFTGDLPAAVRMATRALEGSYAVVAIAKNDDCIVAVRQGSPVIIGVGDGEFIVASDVLPILKRTQDVVYLDNGQMAVIRGGELQVFDEKQQRIPTTITHVDGESQEVTSGVYDTFMRKEIEEQPAAIERCLRGRITLGDVPETCLPELARFFHMNEVPRRIVFAACGTSYHASLVAKRSIERLCRVPVDVRFASELRLQDTLLRSSDLLVAVSQSGETADTLACVELAKARSVPVLAVCNVDGSSLVRAAKVTVLTHAGPEISVASTKAFSTQAAALGLISATLARRVGRGFSAEVASELEQLVALPSLIRSLLAAEGQIAAAAKVHADARMFAFLGKDAAHPMALEGALKLAELTYVPAAGFAAGELKHGPLAMVDETVSIVCLIGGGPSRTKMHGTIQEVRARGGRVLAFDTGDGGSLGEGVDHIRLPTAPPSSAALVCAVALQLFAYHVARTLGRDVDHPRNLAKSVTVE
ncbi:MAG: glutamine--fructose-6-phosphate transaminase (isomerizing) [Nannocystaceae bacterium]|nr:glutamine--fructose-6-phosphate transaminase (isomerizing) [Nannocystaceae bacterium]